MKAHKFKSKLTTQDEVMTEFNLELKPKIEDAITKAIGDGASMQQRIDYMNTKESVMSIARVKLDLFNIWERKGRNMAFLKGKHEFNYMNLLNQIAFGAPLK